MIDVLSLVSGRAEDTRLPGYPQRGLKYPRLAKQIPHTRFSPEDQDKITLRWFRHSLDRQKTGQLGLSRYRGSVVALLPDEAHQRGNRAHDEIDEDIVLHSIVSAGLELTAEKERRIEGFSLMAGKVVLHCPVEVLEIGSSGPP